MPFKSEAQRRFMYAKHPEIAERWQKHTPKGEKLPEKVAEAMKAGFLDELLKISAATPKVPEPSMLEGAAEWVGKHPGTSALAAGGATAAGVLGSGLMRRAAPLSSAVGRRMQDMAREGIHIIKHTRAKDVEEAIPFLSKVRGRISSLGFKPVYATSEGYAMKANKGLKGVSAGLDIDSPISGAEIGLGGMPTKGRQSQRVARALDKLDKAGKPEEAAPYVGLQDVFPKGMPASDVLKKHKIKKPGKDLEQQKKFLNSLQGSLQKEYGDRDFLLKPSDLVASSGAFPNKAGNWGEIWQDYTTRLKPQMDALAKDIEANPHKYPLDRSAQNVIAERFRKDPAYVGTAMEAAIKNPKRALTQELMDVVKNRRGGKAEYRIHMVGGEVPDQLAYERSDAVREVMKRIPLVKNLRNAELGTPEEAAAWAREHVAPRMNRNLRKGTFGLDVMRIRNPDGTLGYKLVELNPTTVEGGSGFLHPSWNPAIAQDLSQWLRGKDAPLVAAGKALGAGGIAGGGTYAATS